MTSKRELCFLSHNIGSTFKDNQDKIKELLIKNEDAPSDVILIQETFFLPADDWAARVSQLKGSSEPLAPPSYKCYAATRESFAGYITVQNSGAMSNRGGVCIFVREKDGVSSEPAKGMELADRLFHLKLIRLQRLRLAKEKLAAAKGSGNPALLYDAQSQLDASKRAFEETTAEGITANSEADILSMDIRAQADLINAAAKLYHQLPSAPSDAQKTAFRKRTKWGGSGIVAAIVTHHDHTRPYLVFSIYRHTTGVAAANLVEEDRCLIEAIKLLQAKNPSAEPLWAGDFNKYSENESKPIYVDFLNNMTILNRGVTNVWLGTATRVDLFLCLPGPMERLVVSAGSVDRLVDRGHTYSVQLRLKAPQPAGIEDRSAADIEARVDDLAVHVAGMVISPGRSRLGNQLRKRDRSV